MIQTQTMIDYPVFGDNGAKEKPGDAKYSAGFVPADVLPAEWLNWLLNKDSAAITTINGGLYVVEKELNALLTAAGNTPDNTDGQVLQSIQYLITSKTGTLSNLTTTDKSNLVAAVNEVVAITGAGSVTTAKLADGAVTLPKINADAKTAALTSGSTKLVSSGAAYSGVQSANKGIIITENPVDGKSFFATLAGLTVEVGTTVKVLFKQDCVTEGPTFQLNDSEAKPIKVVQNGSIVAIPSHYGYWDLDTTAANTTLKVWQANTLLELMHTGSEWLVMGNPIVAANSKENNGYSVYSDGLIEQQISRKGTSSGYNTILFFVPYSNSNYGLSYTPTYNYSDGTSWRVFGSEKTTTFYKVYSSSNVLMNLTTKGF